MFNSLLDQDQYNLTMQQALLKLGFASVPVVYKFKCRNKNVKLNGIYQKIKWRISSLQDISLKNDEYDYLKSLRYFKEDYLNFLRYFRYDMNLVNVSLDKNQDLVIEVRGPWFNTILFEIPILYIVSEAYCDGQSIQHNFAMDKMKEKVSKLPDGFKFADFGTRRRASETLQEGIVGYCSKYVKDKFVGTSNLYLAMHYDIKAMGTMSHQWTMAHQQLNYRVGESQKMAFENWIKVYRGDLGYALADTINTDAFLRDFDDPLFYKLFDGVREDSEPDPINFGHRIINFYLQRKIDPKSKSIIFSNGLTFDQAVKIYFELHNLINVSFGIGTNLTNDTGKARLDIVMKMTECNGQPVAKISNEPSKAVCESPEFLSYLKQVYHVE
jgi:nicotinate phosphoribosyltransferase